MLKRLQLISPPIPFLRQGGCPKNRSARECCRRPTPELCVLSAGSLPKSGGRDVDHYRVIYLLERHEALIAAVVHGKRILE